MKKYLDEKRTIRTGIFIQYSEKMDAWMANAHPEKKDHTIKSREVKRRFYLPDRSGYRYLDFTFSGSWTKFVKIMKPRDKPYYHGPKKNQFPLSAKHLFSEWMVL